jgi:hypothetical protein
LVVEATGGDAWTGHLKALREALWGEAASAEIAEEGQENWMAGIRGRLEKFISELFNSLGISKERKLII